jgi:hypothetical protein
MNLIKKVKIVKNLFGTFDQFVDKIIDQNSRNGVTVKNTFADLILDPKNGFDECQTRNQIVMFILGVSAL